MRSLLNRYSKHSHALLIPAVLVGAALIVGVVTYRAVDDLFWALILAAITAVTMASLTSTSSARGSYHA